MDESQKNLMKELMALEFMALDLHLYLNTHPCDNKALMIFVSTVQRANMVKANYERMYGPITAAGSNSYPWPWINGPWPWEGMESKDCCFK